MQINSFEEIQRYLQDVNATKEEIEEVMYWVQRGVSIYDNPWCYATEQGYQMDIVTALRTDAALREEHIEKSSDGCSSL